MKQREYYETLLRTGKRPTLICGCGCKAELDPTHAKFIWSRDFDLAFVDYTHMKRLEHQLEDAESQQAKRSYYYA